MNKPICFLSILFLFSQCNSSIKNENATVTQEEGVEIPASDKALNETDNKSQNVNIPASENDLYGFWVGYFEKDGDDDDYKKNVYAGEAFQWNRENKINISIDKIEGEKVTGHSVVAGNNRPFTGTVKNLNGVFHFEVKEPGDNKYDGAFAFSIDDSLLEGTWQSFKKIDISKRKYELKKKKVQYNADILLEQNSRYVNWEKPEKQDDKETEEFNERFASATDMIYLVNASNKLLTKYDVENLQKGDLLIIRNTIYARHGYSFKSRPLRVFFDAQTWYVPAYTDIKTELTEIELKNIALLLRYEKNANEYYDNFGRG